MCDYSVQAAKQSRACVNDSIVTRRFNEYTKGFVFANDRSHAACLVKGHKVVLRNLPETLLTRLEVGDEPEAYYCYMPQDTGRYHTSALVFRNGRSILIHDLPIGT